MQSPDANAATDDTLRPLNDVIPEVIEDDKNPATYWRCSRRGIAVADGKRIRLQVW